MEHQFFIQIDDCCCSALQSGSVRPVDLLLAPWQCDLAPAVCRFGQNRLISLRHAKKYVSLFKHIAMITPVQAWLSEMFRLFQLQCDVFFLLYSMRHRDAFFNFMTSSWRTVVADAQSWVRVGMETHCIAHVSADQH